MEELKHKMSTIGLQSEIAREMVFPFLQLISEEMENTFQTMFRNSRSLQTLFQYLQQYNRQMTRSVQEWWENSYHVLNDVIPETVNYWTRSGVKMARKQCKRFEMCYKTVYAIENYGFSSLFDLFTSGMMNMLQQSHRLVIQTSGRLARSLPSPPEWIQDVWAQYRNSISNFISDSIFGQEMSKILRKTYSEVLSNSEIDFNQVKEFARDLTDLVISRASLSSGTRVLVWDPMKGRIQLEFREMASKTRFRRSITESMF